MESPLGRQHSDLDVEPLAAVCCCEFIVIASCQGHRSTPIQDFVKSTTLSQRLRSVVGSTAGKSCLLVGLVRG